jgi:DNA-binding Lrp family transcriptional regulator
MSLFMLPMLPSNAWQLIADDFAQLSWMMVGSSLAAFLSIVMYTRALGKGSMAVVNSLSAISVVLGIPTTLIGNFFIPSAFGNLGTDPFLWTLKILGIILVMIGIVALQASDIRSLVIVKVKPLTGDLLPELFAIKGVEKAAAIAGGIDYLLTVKSRNLSKTRTLILDKIQKVPGIEHIETLVIIREYR